MTLGEKQQVFMVLVAKLILYADSRGDAFRGGELLRTQEQANLYAKAGKGSRNSVHMQKLAIDLLLFQRDQAGIWQYRTDSDAYRPYGDWWKAQATADLECCWGGDWKGAGVVADGNHFSIAHGGYK